jgi:radical SAM protein with 4Fe4S-binding SPASM domain
MEPMIIRKIEIWTGGETDLGYCYSCVPDKGGRMEPGTTRRALELLVKDESGSVSPNLQVDFIGQEPMKEFDMVAQLQEYREFVEAKNGRRLHFRVITAGSLDDEKMKFLLDNGITLRNSLTSMEPTDEWWHGKKGEGDTPSGTLKKKIPSIRKTFGEFQHRLVISRENFEIRKRVEAQQELGAESVLLTPRLTTTCTPDDAPSLKASMDDYAQWLKEGILAGNMPPVVNSTRLLHMIHRFNLGDPVPIKNHCNDTCQRVMLDTDGIFRPCRHFHLYPRWSLGNVEEGVFHSRRLNLFRYGNVRKGGCRKCIARFYCSGPCISASAVYAESQNYPMGYHCLFTKMHTEAMDCLYNLMKVENPEALWKCLKMSRTYS